MKVQGPGGVRSGSPIVRRDKARAGAGDFAQTIRDTGETAEAATATVGGVSPLNIVEALLSLQEVVGDAGGRGGAACAEGHNSLISLRKLEWAC